MLNQLQFCEDQGIPWAVIIGTREMSEGVVTLRNVGTRQEEVGDGTQAKITVILEGSIREFGRRDEEKTQ